MEYISGRYEILDNNDKNLRKTEKYILKNNN